MTTLVSHIKVVDRIQVYQGTFFGRVVVKIGTEESFNEQSANLRFTRNAALSNAGAEWYDGSGTVHLRARPFTLQRRLGERRGVRGQPASVQRRAARRNLSAVCGLVAADQRAPLRRPAQSRSTRTCWAASAPVAPTSARPSRSATTAAGSPARGRATSRAAMPRAAPTGPCVRSNSAVRLTCRPRSLQIAACEGAARWR